MDRMNTMAPIIFFFVFTHTENKKMIQAAKLLSFHGQASEYVRVFKNK